MQRQQEQISQDRYGTTYTNGHTQPLIKASADLAEVYLQYMQMVYHALSAATLGPLLALLQVPHAQRTITVTSNRISVACALQEYLGGRTEDEILAYTDAAVTHLMHYASNCEGCNVHVELLAEMVSAT